MAAAIDQGAEAVAHAAAATAAVDHATTAAAAAGVGGGDVVGVQLFHQSCPSGVEVQDTTGAGDVFAAG